MSCDFVILSPRSYSSKSHKLNEFREAENFLQIFERKINEWNFKYLYEKEPAIAHKIKYNDLMKVYLTSCHLALYIVCSSSKSSFENSFKKLVNTCHKKDIIGDVIVLSLQKDHFNLKDVSVDVIYFTDNNWSSEEDYQWKMVEQSLKIKLQDIENNNNSISTQKTLPLSIPDHNRTHNLKKFINSLPSKFDLKKEKSLKNKTPTDNSVPNIKISEYAEEIISNETEFNDLESKHKKDHKLFSLKSLFNKQRKKTKDAGLSLESPTSSWGGSKKSDTVSIEKSKSLEMIFDGMSEASPPSEKSNKNKILFLENSKNSNIKKHSFKDKANKTLQSVSCVQSFQNRHKNQVEDALSGVAYFSSFLISASSDMPINDLKFDEYSHTIMSSFNQRCKSEPPINEIKPLIKYYSWNESMIKYDENINNELKYINNQEIKLHASQLNNCNGSDLNEINEHHYQYSEFRNCLSVYNDNKKYYTDLSNKTNVQNIKNDTHEYFTNGIYKDHQIHGIEVFKDKKYETTENTENYVFNVHDEVSYQKSENETLHKGPEEKINNNLKMNECYMTECHCRPKNEMKNENITQDEYQEGKVYSPEEKKIFIKTIDEKKIVNKDKKDNNAESDENIILKIKSKDTLEMKRDCDDKKTKEDIFIDNDFNVQYVQNIENNVRKHDQFIPSKLNDAKDNSKEIKVNEDDQQIILLKTFQFNKECDFLNVENEAEIEHSKELLREIKVSCLKDTKHSKNKPNKNENKITCINNEYKMEHIDIIQEVKNSKVCLKDRINFYSSISDISDSIVVISTQTYIYHKAYTLINNPIFVASMFTATAFTATMWKNIIPSYFDFSYTLYQTISRVLQNDMVQIIPNQLISASRVGTNAITKSLNRYFIVVPSSNPLIGRYNIFFC